MKGLDNIFQYAIILVIYESYKTYRLIGIKMERKEGWQYGQSI